MKLSQSQIQVLARKISKKTKDSKFSNSLVIEEVLSMLSEQRPCYSEFNFLGKGEFSLVLEAKKSSGCVALKIVEFDQSNYNAIEAVKREYEILNSLQTCGYVVKLNDSFFLTEEQEQFYEGFEVDNEEVEQQKSKELGNVTTVNRYFVQETELCKGSLAEYLSFLRNNSIILEERMKFIMVAQMLDAVNFLHQKNIAHRDIKSSNFLFQEKEGLINLKLSDFGFTTTLDKNSTNFMIGKRTPGYSAPEVEQGQSRKESDNFSLGIIILEIDNCLKFDYSQVSNAEFVNLQQGKGIFPKHNLNTSSVLFQMAQALLLPKYQGRATSQQLLLLLLKEQNTNLNNIPIYSIILENQLSLFTISNSQLKNKNTEQMEKLKQISTSLNPSEETTKKNIDSLLVAYQKQYNTNSLSQIQVQEVLRALFLLGAYENLQLLGTGSQGLIIGGLNKKQQRQSTLKICLCENKADIFRQIAILKKCQMPRIVKFYGYQFIKDENNNEYVVFEMERCQSSLKQYLDEQCLNNSPYSPEQKMELAIQMIDSVNYLHELEILHSDIKLDNFLISEDEKGEIVVKLTGFDQAAQLEENCDWKEKNSNNNYDDKLLPPYYCAIILDKLGTFPYYAPERFNPLNPATTQTDAYSLGLCLLVLDNYLTFSEERLVQKQLILIQPYSEPFLESEDVIIDRMSELYKITKKLLAYLPNDRSSLSKILQDSQIIGQAFSIQSEKAAIQNSLEQISYFKLDKSSENLNLELIVKQISNLTNLSYLSLNLDSKSIEDSGVNYLSTALIKLNNLSSLFLELSYNTIGDKGVNYLFTSLNKLINLSSLSLNLANNQIGNEGVKDLSTALIKLINLSSLSLNLRNNNSIDASCVNYLSTSLIKFTNLSSLSLNLWDNKSIGEPDLTNLSTELVKLINLSSISLYIMNIISVGNQGVNYLSPSLIKLINLSNQSLNHLNNKSIGESGVSKIFTALFTLTNLSSLSLDLNRYSLGEQGVNYLSIALIKLINLQRLSLNLCDNLIGDEGVNYLSTALVKLLSLSSLSLNLKSNSIKDEGVNYLSNALSKLIILSSLSLNLGNNQICDSGINYLSTALSELFNLSSLSLDLCDNSIGESGANYLSTALIKLINLQRLFLNVRGNPIRESDEQNIFPLIDNLNLKHKSIIF